VAMATHPNLDLKPWRWNSSSSWVSKQIRLIPAGAVDDEE